MEVKVLMQLMGVGVNMVRGPPAPVPVEVGFNIGRGSATTPFHYTVAITAKEKRKSIRYAILR